MKTEILHEIFDGYEIAVLLKENIIWDVCIRHDALKDIYTPVSVTLSRHDTSQNAFFAVDSNGNDYILYGDGFTAGQEISGYIDKFMDDPNKLPVIKVGQAPCSGDSLSIMQYRHGDDIKTISETGLLESQDIMAQLQELNENMVHLHDGTRITCNKTAAIHVFDIDKGASTSATSANFKAAKEIARQIYLRNISGLMVIDFIRMNEEKLRQDIENKLKKPFIDTPQDVQFYGFSKAGLYEMSRKNNGRGIKDYLNLIF